MPNDAKETTQSEFDKNAAGNPGTLNNAGQETQTQEEADNATIINPPQVEPGT